MRSGGSDYSELQDGVQYVRLPSHANDSLFCSQDLLLFNHHGRILKDKEVPALELCIHRISCVYERFLPAILKPNFDLFGLNIRQDRTLFN